MNGPSDNIRTAIGVSVGLTSGLVIIYYFIRLCRTIAMYPKDDTDEILPAYQPPSTLPATSSFCYQDYNDNDDDSNNGFHPSRANTRMSTRNYIQDFGRVRAPTTIPAQPSPTYSRPPRNSRHYHNGEMTQIGHHPSLPAGIYALALPPAPTRPPRSPLRSAGLNNLVASLSGRTSSLPAGSSNTPTETEVIESPPSYSDVVAESRSQPPPGRILHTTAIIV